MYSIFYPKNKTTFKLFLFPFFHLSILLSQVSYSSSLISNFATSKNNFNYFENYYDLNLLYNNWNLWIEMEYSNPPALGYGRSGIRNMRLEYSGKKANLKIGDLYEFWGNGLVLNSLDDKSIDFNNGITGIYLNIPYAYLEMDFLIGKQAIDRSSNRIPGFNDRIHNYRSDFNILGNRLKLNLDNIDISLHYLSAKQNDRTVDDSLSVFDHEIIGLNLNYFSNYFGFLFELVSKDNNGNGLFSDINIYLSDFLFTDFTTFGIGYKNYFFSNRSPSNRWDIVDDKSGYIPFQQMPTVFMAHNSILLSRLTHVIDYNDEVGYNAYIKMNMLRNSTLLLSYSLLSRNSEWKMNENFEWFNESNGSSNISRLFLPTKDAFFNPAEEIYLEIDGYDNKDIFYYKLAFSKMNSVVDIFENQWLMNDKNNLYRSSFSYELKDAISVPLSLMIKLSERNSINIAFEYQKLKKGFKTLSSNTNNSQFFSNFTKDFQFNRYIGIGFSSSPKWSINLGIDYTDTEERIVLEKERFSNKIEDLLSPIFDPSLTWINFESSYNLNQNYRLSISYGSKRGGVYCSNGICRYIQPFENGFNFEVIALF